MAELTTWAKAQERLGYTAGEKAVVEGWIAAACAAADTYTNRKLAAADYTLQLDGPGRQVLQLPQWPINSVTSVHQDATRAFGAATEVTDYVQYDDIGHLWRQTGWSEGRATIQVVCNLGYSTVPADLENAVIELVSYYYERQKAQAIGIRAITSPDGINTAYELEAPLGVRRTFARYRKVVI